MKTGIDEANADADPPCDPFGDNVNRNSINDKGNDEDGDEDGDSSAVDGPTVEAYVVLAKRGCKYHVAG